MLDLIEAANPPLPSTSTDKQNPNVLGDIKFASEILRATGGNNSSSCVGDPFSELKDANVAADQDKPPAKTVVKHERAFARCYIGCCDGVETLR